MASEGCGRKVWWWALMVGVCAMMLGAAPRLARAVSISGTIHYSGTRGPVSASQPLLLFIWDTPSPTTDPLAFGTVTTNGGAFQIDVPSVGTYYLAYLLDSDGDGDASVGESFGVYHNRTVFPGDPLTAPQSGISLTFGDASLLPGVAGTVTYTGSQGPVSAGRPLTVQQFGQSDFSGGSQNEKGLQANGDRYNFVSFDAGPVYLRAFLDLNGNDQPDVGEPFEIYNGKTSPPGDPVVPGSMQTAVDFTFGDPAVSCVGDCSGDGAVTIDELLTMVNIALGSAPVSNCLPGDGNDDGSITVDEILAAVNHALNGC